MTDNEIVKALECLRGKQIFCKECKYSAHLHYRECQQAAANDALDLINRQKAEIRETRRDLLNEIISLEHQLETAKAEARKEFAERLKESKYQSSDWSHGEHPFVVEVDDIDNLVKEMTGDADEH